MHKSPQDSLAFAQSLIQRQDIRELTQAVESKISAECDTPGDLVATLTLNYVAAVVGMARETDDLSSTINMLNTVFVRAMQIRIAELERHTTNPQTVH